MRTGQLPLLQLVRLCWRDTAALAEGYKMCLICIDLQRDKLTVNEARRNLGETYKALDKDHTLEVLKLIWKKEDEESDHDPFEQYLNELDAYGSD